MASIKFTTKKYSPPANVGFVSSDHDPVFVRIEEVNFPTDKGDKKVSEISFFPNSTIKQADIKQRLGIKGMKVLKLTFKIEIDKIEFKDSPEGPSMTASSGAFMSKEPTGNTLRGGRLELRDYNLNNITQATSSSKPEGDDEDDSINLTFNCAQCNKEVPTSEAKEYNGSRYCSDACKDKAREKLPQKECPQCHEKFANLPVSGSQGKSYCSDKCKQAAEESDGPGPGKPNEPDNPTPSPQQQFDDAEKKRKTQAAQNKQALEALIEKGEGQEKVDELKVTLEQIEQKSSTVAYQELKGKINSLKNKLNGKLTIDEVKVKETAKLEALLTKNGLKKADLPAEIQTELNEVGSASEVAQVVVKVEKVSRVINQKGVEKKFDSLWEKVGKVGENESSKKSELKKQLEKLLESDDRFIQNYIQTHRSQIENALVKLAAKRQKQPNSPNQKTGLSTGQKVAIGVGIIGGVAILTGLVIFLVRHKKSSRYSKN